VSGSSWKHYYEPIASTSLTFDRPVDTFSTRVAMDNVAHLVDSAPVYRVNWVDPSGFPTLPYAFIGGTHWQYAVSAHEFPTTLLRQGRYVGFDVRVAASITHAAPGIVTATIATPDVAYPITDPDAPGIIGHTSVTFNSVTPTWVIDTQFTGDDKNVQPQFGYMSCTNNSEYAPGTQTATPCGRLRCIVAILGIWPNEDYTTEYAKIYGIQVREYPVE
jgi:hypothetical protein